MNNITHIIQSEVARPFRFEQTEFYPFSRAIPILDAFGASWAGGATWKWAANFDCDEYITFKFLWKMGKSEIEVRDDLWRTPLHRAAEKGHIKIVEFLLANGANIEATDGVGYTPLLFAAEKGKTEIVEFLLKKGANLEVQDYWGGTPLHVALFFYQREVAELFLEKGANLEARDYSRRTPLHRAAEKGETEIVEFLLKKGANLEARDYSRRTPLHLAGFFNQRKVAELLLKKGANLEAQDILDHTPLYYAALFGDEELIDLLIEHGVVINLNFLIDKCKSSEGSLVLLIAFIKYIFHNYQVVFEDESFLKKLIVLDSVVMTKLLSHWLNIPGKTELPGGLSLKLNGAVSAFFIDSCADLLEDFTTSEDFDRMQFSKKKINVIQTAIRKISLKNFYKEVGKNIRNKDLVFFQSGWKSHHIYLVFYDQYLAICNRGGGSEDRSTIEVFKIDPNLMTERVIRQIQIWERACDASSGELHFFTCLPDDLTKKTEQDDFCTSFKQIAPKNQKSGNCSLASLKAAIRFAWGVLDLPSERDLQRTKLETKVFTDWAATKVFEQGSRFIEEDKRVHALAVEAEQKKRSRYQENMKKVLSSLPQSV